MTTTRGCIILFSCISLIWAGQDDLWSQFGGHGLGSSEPSTERSTSEPLTDLTTDPFPASTEYFTGPSTATLSTFPPFTGPSTDPFLTLSAEPFNDNSTDQLTTQPSQLDTGEVTIQQSTEHATTMTSAVQCYNGTCSVNASDEKDYSCISATITDTCDLADGDSCFQNVFMNSSSNVIIVEVGCASDCEFIIQDDEITNVLSITRCCDTHVCNNQRLNDPDNSAASMTSSTFAIICIVVYII